MEGISISILNFVVWSLFLKSSVAIDFSCYTDSEFGDSSRKYACTATTVREQDRCRLLCSYCTSPDLYYINVDQSRTVCHQNWEYDPNDVLDVVTNAFLNMSTAHGQYWMDDTSTSAEVNYTQSVAYLLGNMPLRDQQLLFPGNGGFSFEVMNWLNDHVRFSLQARHNWPASNAVPWDVFLEYVLPYAVLDERRDVSFNWRAKFYQLFYSNISLAPSIYSGAEIIADLLPSAQIAGTYGLNDDLFAGPVVKWKSESSPGILSTKQVVDFGGSCTGTGITMLAAFRSVGIPARLAGCSNEYVDGAWLNDDHHWVEFWDNTSNGPFADEPEWHTKEGTSAGNEGGPWDSPSGPMNGCLANSVPGDSEATLWVTSWSSDTFLPTQWHDDAWSQRVGFVGGINRCGAYCTAWGCGVNQTDYWTQRQCEPSNSRESRV